MRFETNTTRTLDPGIVLYQCVMPLEGAFLTDTQPMHWLRCSWSDRGLHAIALASGPSDRDPAPAWIADPIREYCAGQTDSLAQMPIVLAGTPFQQAVYHALCALEPGSTCSYKELSMKLGIPSGARAVGQAVRSNSILMVVPCHRVIRHDGSLGGYSGGLEFKRALLKHEQFGDPSPPAYGTFSELLWD